MTSPYKETEIKILDIDAKSLQEKVEKLGAKKVFDADRVFITFDTKDRKYTSQNKIIRLTEEDRFKLSYDALVEENRKESVKVFVSRKQETVDFLARLGLYPIAEVKSHRISYELGETDIDIDQFPEIPATVEIDYSGVEMLFEDFLKELGIDKNKRFTIGTEKLYDFYGKNYFELFKI